MRVVSYFSGAGGLDLGFHDGCHEIVWANDIYDDAVKTYRKNIGNHILHKDIRDVSIKEIPDCDLIIGGFPCQGFSVANTRRNSKDSRNYLYQEILKGIKHKQPKYFLAENVKGILSLEKGKILQMIVHDFENAGYRLKYDVLNAADFGVPQHRYRVLFLGTRKDIKEDIDFPCPTHADPEKCEILGLKPWNTVGDALSSIPDPDLPNNIKNHTYSKYKLRFNGYLGHRIIDPKKPAPTITARGDDKGGVVVLHHPSNERRMSARELAIIQSFSLDYEFCGCQSSVYRQIANAVPPLMARALSSIFPS